MFPPRKNLPPLLLPLLLGASLLAAAEPDDSAFAPFRDPGRPLDARVADLIARLTVEEKAQLLNHRGTPVARFNLRADQWNQCLNGVKWDRPTTMFPTCVAMAIIRGEAA